MKKMINSGTHENILAELDLHIQSKRCNIEHIRRTKKYLVMVKHVHIFENLAVKKKNTENNQVTKFQTVPTFGPNNVILFHLLLYSTFLKEPEGIWNYN